MWLLFLMCLEGPRLQTVWRLHLPEHGFLKVPIAAVSSGDNLCLAEGDGYHLAFFDRNGKLVTSQGNFGAEEGEHMKIRSALYSDALKTFVIHDAHKKALSVYAQTGWLAHEKRVKAKYRNPILLDDQRLLYRREESGSKTLMLYHGGEGASAAVASLSPQTSNVAMGPNILALYHPTSRSIVVYGLDDLKQESTFSIDTLQQGHIQRRQKEEVPDGYRVTETLETHLYQTLKIDAANRIWVFGYARDSLAIHDYAVYDKSGEMVGRGFLEDVPLAISTYRLYMMEARELNHGVLKCVRFRLKK